MIKNSAFSVKGNQVRPVLTAAGASTAIAVFMVVLVLVRQEMQLPAVHTLAVFGHKLGLGASHERANAAGRRSLYRNGLIFRLIANEHAFVIAEHDRIIGSGEQVVGH